MTPFGVGGDDKVQRVDGGVFVSLADGVVEDVAQRAARESGAWTELTGVVGVICGVELGFQVLQAGLVELGDGVDGEYVVRVEGGAMPAGSSLSVNPSVGCS